MAESPLIVAVGGGAGSVTAMEAFLRAAGDGDGGAILVMLHLSPPLEVADLTARLAAATSMPVVAARGGMQLEPGHVYVIPAECSIRAARNHLTLDVVARTDQARAPVDAFFRAVAEAYDGRAAAVILGGDGSHGSTGLKRVKECGGVVMVQAPADAEVSEMPQHAVATGLVDWVLPVSDMPARLASYWTQVSRASRAELADDHAEADSRALIAIFEQLRRRTGHDFSNYKRPTVLRRLERRMGVHGVQTLASYVQVLEQEGPEADALLKDLLISVTHFFRDPETFQALAERVIPAVFEATPASQPVRAWVAGCATGEEAYSVAMLLAEHAERRSPGRSIQVFATDLDGDAIAHARHAVYTAADVADVSPERLRAFFTAERHGYRVRRGLREVVLFAEHNLLKDPPFLHMQLATCRNLLIYFNRTAQERAIETLHFALAPHGYLLVGSSESIDDAADLFTMLDKDHHIYESRNVAPRLSTDLHERGSRPTAPSRRPPGGAAGGRSGDEPWAWRRSSLELHQHLLDWHSGPSLVVNEDHDLVHVSDRAARYLQFVGGEPSLNVLDLARPELRTAIRAGLLRAVQTGRGVTSDPVAVRVEDDSERVVVRVRPALAGPELPGRFFLVIFDSVAVSASADEPATGDTGGAHSLQALVEDNRELRAQLRAARAQFSTQAAEFESANEELHATNEELRSATEELQTSKEELGAVNEELHTVNEELKSRIDELSQANSDLRNLVAATEIGTVFLDSALHIKLFTPAVRAFFNLLPSDIGRPLDDIRSTLIDARLSSEAATVLERGVSVQKEVHSRTGQHYLMRIVPYRQSENRIDGLVVTFVDLTALRQAGEALRQSEERFRLLSDSGLISIAFLDAGGVFTDANDALLTLFGYTRQELLAGALRLDRLTPPEWSARTLAALEEFRQTGAITPFQKEYLRRDGSRFWGLLGAARLEGSAQGVAFVIDVTARIHPFPGEG